MLSCVFAVASRVVDIASVADYLGRVQGAIALLRLPLPLSRSPVLTKMTDKFDKAVEIGNTPLLVSPSLNRAHLHTSLHASQRSAQRGLGSTYPGRQAGSKTGLYCNFRPSHR
jgi:hypothetical protein